MKDTYTGPIKQTDSCLLGWIEEIPGVNCHEATKDELVETLRVTLHEAIDFRRRDGW